MTITESPLKESVFVQVSFLTNWSRPNTCELDKYGKFSVSSFENN